MQPLSARIAAKLRPSASVVEFLAKSSWFWDVGEEMSASAPVVEVDGEQIESQFAHSVAEAQNRKLGYAKTFQFLVLVALFALPTLTAIHIHTVADPDVWWHLRAGEWVFQHRAVPSADPFSAFAQGKPWAAYSWLYELLVFALFEKFGSIGILAYIAGMVLAIAWAINRLVRSLQADFSIAVLISAAAFFCLPRLWTPRSWLFSILLFVLELHVLLLARKTGKIGHLLWLPLIFAFWANLHIQFVYGMLVLAAAAMEPVCARFGWRTSSRLRCTPLSLTLVACGLASCCNPYGWNLYKIAFNFASQTGVYDKILDLQAPSFRGIGDWCLLVLAFAAIAALARSPRVEFFEFALLAFATYSGFRSQRDIWILVIIASLILAARIPGAAENRFVLPRLGVAGALVVAAAMAVLYSSVAHVNASTLSENVAENLPVDAVREVKAHGWKGPLYNNYDWGGYLIWALRLPVSIDGRSDLYGDEYINRSIATWDARKDWASDPDLSKANLVIAPVQSPLTQVLRLSPSFRLVFEDKLAAVFVSRAAMAGAVAPSGQRNP